MISTRTILLLTITLTASGCQWHSQQKEARFVDPVLPMAMSRNELVEHLNRQNEGLQCWQCKDTRVHVSMPGLPFPQKLSGTLSCSAPSQFRLMAGSLIVNADFGSNDAICWAYVKPGESTVLTWRHEDSHLLRHIPGGLRLEPSWLMTILGVQPLNPASYDLQSAPAGSRELWLVAVEDAPDGTSLRRVIKVDTVTGVAREHALYDSEGNPLLRAQLSHHRSCSGHLMPHMVKLRFPQNETELTLEFRGIETDCRIAETVWNPPQGRFIEHVDLGELVRSRMPKRTGVRPISHRNQAAPDPNPSSDRIGQYSTALLSRKEEAPGVAPQDETSADDEAQTDHFSGSETAWDDTDVGGPDRVDVDGPADPEFPQQAEVESSTSSDRPDFDITAPTAAHRSRPWWRPFGQFNAQP